VAQTPKAARTVSKFAIREINRWSESKRLTVFLCLPYGVARRTSAREGGGWLGMLIITVCLSAVPNEPWYELIGL
jgi:hypothetical protein